MLIAPDLVSCHNTGVRKGNPHIMDTQDIHWYVTNAVDRIDCRGLYDTKTDPWIHESIDAVTIASKQYDLTIYNDVGSENPDNTEYAIALVGKLISCGKLSDLSKITNVIRNLS
jgi:hypothetical protein